MTSQEMMRARAKPGCIWVNIAAVDEAPDWREHKAPVDWHRTTDQITRDSDKLFGYDREAFMAKQYR